MKTILKWLFFIVLGLFALASFGALCEAVYTMASYIWHQI